MEKSTLGCILQDFAGEPDPIWWTAAWILERVANKGLLVLANNEICRYRLAEGRTLTEVVQAVLSIQKEGTNG